MELINPINIVNSYEQYSGIVDLFYDDEKVEERRTRIRNQICTHISPYLVEECAIQELCEDELADV